MNYLANIGLYLLKSEITKIIPKNKSLKWTPLLKKLKNPGEELEYFQ